MKVFCRHVTFIMNECAQLRGMAADILYEREYDKSGSVVGEHEISVDSEVKAEMDVLLRRLDQNMQRLRRALEATGESDDIFALWLSVARKKRTDDTPDDPRHRLRNFIQMCDGLIEREAERQSDTYRKV